MIYTCYTSALSLIKLNGILKPNSLNVYCYGEKPVFGLTLVTRRNWEVV